MKRIEDVLQWPSMPQKPDIWENHHSQNPNSIFQTLNPYLSQSNQFYQNPSPRNHLHQNPISHNHLLLPQNQQSHPYQMNLGGLESGLLINPSLSDPLQNYISLEEALNRINLSAATPSHYQPQFFEENSTTFSDLNRMRSIYAGLGLLRDNSNALSDSQYQNGGHDMASLRENNRANYRRSRRNPVDDRLGYSPSIRPNTHLYGFRGDSVRSINGLESGESSRIFHSSLNNGKSSVNYHYSSVDLEQVKGRIDIVAKDQEGSRFLQKKIEEPNQTEIIFLELKDHVCDLIVDQFANGVIQKLFVICNEAQMTQLLLPLIKNEQRLLDICIHQHGTRGVQKLIERIKTPDQSLALISALKHITVALSKNNNGHHVIQQCFKCFSVDVTKCLLEEIANSCLEIAMDKSGCCVLQKTMTRAEGALKDRLLAEVAANALVLSEHPYGNYVVQYVLEMKIPHAEESILERLEQNFVALSKNKYGSNVVEKCMKECSENNSARVVLELMRSKDFLEVVQDAYGNYVIQTALGVYKGEVLYHLARKIELDYPFLHSHLHGKKVLAMLARTRGNRSNRM